MVIDKKYTIPVKKMLSLLIIKEELPQTLGGSAAVLFI